MSQVPEQEQQSRTERASEAPAEEMLAVDDLRKSYGDGEDAVRAVDGVSLSVRRGEVVGVLGPNGAGKTTTIKSILGLVVPSGGTVTIAGVDADENPRGVYRHVGAMLEGARNVYWRLTVRENLNFFAALGGNDPDAARDRHDRLLDQFGLADKADEPVNELSRGQKQKVSLAATLARGTDVVFLDEPTLGLDVEASVELRRELRRLADEEAITIVLSSHDMDVVEAVCDRVVILSNGRVIADDPVEELVGVFETQVYRLTVDGRVPEQVRTELTASYQVDDWERLDDRTRFDVTLAEDDALYDVLGVLRTGDCALLDVDGLEPDLEDVFLDVTDRAPDESGGEDE
ncbi:ABC transporter ATP-binding protein [Halolamina sp. CBA1230]|uniref:ABC transporter ATP-binding protein n=1 Tax=Halolamina sp. CBA1230 TaxID=1853690 RepID=UPI0009A25376|nr:ABC transporter ATP-binding protein [Halolamina sp. CBA1230]QKY21096.1 ABC transporter ATP-binding protein [Halolamina sp. CBA1230]